MDYELLAKDDGLWLYAKTASGKHTLINLTVTQVGEIVPTALREIWTELREAATAIPSPFLPGLRQTLELDGPEPAPIRVAGFLRHYAGIIRRHEYWDVPETMANAYESAAAALEAHHAPAVASPSLSALVERWRTLAEYQETQTQGGMTGDIAAVWIDFCADELEAALGASSPSSPENSTSTKSTTS